MKIAAVTLARNEDSYAEEWLDYHFRLGVDDIYLVQHAGWKYRGKWFPGLHNFHAGFQAKQTDVVNDMLGELREQYDWILFPDVDEFFCLKNGDNDLKTFLERYDDCNGVCFNWRMFGSSGHVEDGNYRVLERFTHCQRKLNTWVKHALHVSRAPKDAWMVDVHTPMIGTNTQDTIVIVPQVVNVSKKHCQTELSNNFRDLDECLNIAYLAHFRIKTYGEWVKRFQRNNEYWYHVTNSQECESYLSRFYEQDYNDVEELALLRFQQTGSFL